MRAAMSRLVEPGAPPTAKLTGELNTDVVLRSLNDLVKAVSPIFTEMNKELSALETAHDAFKNALSAEQLRSNAQTEADKRIRCRAIIANGRADIAKAVENFVQTAATRYTSTGHRQEIQKGLEIGVRKVSERWDMILICSIERRYRNLIFTVFSPVNDSTKVNSFFRVLSKDRAITLCRLLPMMQQNVCGTFGSDSSTIQI